MVMTKTTRMTKMRGTARAFSFSKQMSGKASSETPRMNPKTRSERERDQISIQL